MDACDCVCVYKYKYIDTSHICSYYTLGSLQDELWVYHGVLRVERGRVAVLVGLGVIAKVQVREGQRGSCVPLRNPCVCHQTPHTTTRLSTPTRSPAKPCDAQNAVFCRPMPPQYECKRMCVQCLP